MKLIILVVLSAFLLAGCDAWVGKNETNTSSSTQQTIIYNESGVPIQVLSRDGLHYINVGEAPIDLLAERGLTRLSSGEVVPIGG